MMRLRSSPVFLKERQPERRFPCWYAIRISVPKTTVRSLPTTARDMADLTFDLKYGFRDYRGGGRSSGRETIGRVAAGAIACKILDQLGIKILTYTKSIGDITADPACFDRSVIMENPFYMPDGRRSKKSRGIS